MIFSGWQVFESICKLILWLVCTYTCAHEIKYFHMVYLRIREKNKLRKSKGKISLYLNENKSG